MTWIFIKRLRVFPQNPAVHAETTGQISHIFVNRDLRSRSRWLRLLPFETSLAAHTATRKPSSLLAARGRPLLQNLLEPIGAPGWSPEDESAGSSPSPVRQRSSPWASTSPSPPSSPTVVGSDEVSAAKPSVFAFELKVHLIL